MIDLKNNQIILTNILSEEDSSFKAINKDIVGTLANSLTGATTINKMLKDIPDLVDTLVIAINNITEIINSKSSLNNLKSIFSKISSNTNFDYFKEIKNVR